MKLKYLLATALLTAGAITGMARQPYGGCWHPDDIKDWSPETDPDARFNRSRVPLAQRFKEPQLMKANANQYYEGQICNATILFPTCSLCPSQGAENFLGYQPTYWQYMDKLVYWAGSASEGIIIPPPAGAIDAAHAQGVKVLGQVFFPPAQYGGNSAWVRQLVTQENGKYIYAVKLYEIAKYFGFDGWFINEESGGASNSEWAGFIKEFNALADANGDTQMEIQWYNASVNPNLTILKTHRNTSQFLEYGSKCDWRSSAESLGCTEEEVYSKIYSGVQCVSAGVTGWGSYLNSAFPKTGHVGSLDLFCPEEHTWKDYVKNLLGTSKDKGSEAYSAITTTFGREETMWVNNSGDPSNTSGSWRGVSGAVLERSVITSLPFASDMNVGVGKHRFVNGQKKQTRDWYHSGMQSILPTWRWWITNRGNMEVSIDWDDAFNGASSFLFKNITAGEHIVRLYKTMIPMPAGATASIAFKGTASPALLLSTTSSVDADVTLAATSTETRNGWTIAKYDLSGLSGKTLYMVALNLDGVGSEFRLGRVALLPGSYAPATIAVSNLSADAELGEETGDARVTWDFDWSADLDHFDVYVSDLSGNSTLVGQTRDEAFYIPRIDRNGKDAYVTIKVVPVMKDGSEQAGASVKAEYPKATAPVVTFTMTRSYIKVGETSTITAHGTGKPTKWAWTLPAGVELAGGSLTSATVTVKGVKEGAMEFSVSSTNDVGTSVTKANILDVMSEADYGSVSNVVAHKTVVSYSGSTNEKEVPEKIIDGITNPKSTSDKWCNVSSDNWVIFDCEGVYRFYGFKIYDCKSGPENNENIRDYTIELSMDGKDWHTVVDRKDQENVNIKEDFIVPTEGRYIRFSPQLAGILRVWEFEAYGVDNTNLELTAEPSELRLNGGETGRITVRYNLNGDQRKGEFGCIATPSNDFVTVGEITEDKAGSTFTIPVTAGNAIGICDLTIRVNNGGAYRETTARIVTDLPSQPNVLKGLEAEVRHYGADYTYGAQYTGYAISKLTDGNTTEEALMEIEEPSTHKQDLWAIFKAPGKAWDLAKVKVFLTDGNKGKNDNDREGFVNNEISIAAGNDLDNMTFVKTFSNLGEISVLEHIFQPYVTANYLAVVCTLNPYFYPSLAEVEAYETPSAGAGAIGEDAGRTVTGIYNLQGMPVKNPSAGIYIILYSDNTTRKVLIR